MGTALNKTEWIGKILIQGKLNDKRSREWPLIKLTDAKINKNVQQQKKTSGLPVMMAVTCVNGYTIEEVR